MQLYLSATHHETLDALKHCRSLAHAAYRIGPGSTLLRQNMLLSVQGGLLSVSDEAAPFIDDPDALCAAAVRECSRRGYDGVLLNFKSSTTQDRLTFAARLEPTLRGMGRRVYLPEHYAEAVPGAMVLIETALSGGSLTEHLQEAAAKWGSNRLVLDIERVRMLFPLPCPSGVGTPLNYAEFQALTEQESPSVFFSPDLCARYFTCHHKGSTQFVLFDDAETLKRKVQIGRECGAAAAILRWAEITDIAEAFFAQN